MTREEILDILSDGHTIISVQTATRVCDGVGVPFSGGLVHKWKSDPKDTFKGLTMIPEYENTEGVYTLALSKYVAEQKGVADKVGSFYGRGRQARAYAEEVAKVI